MNDTHIKLNESISLKCSSEFKEQIAGVAHALHMDASEFVRAAIEKELAFHASMYEALHNVFGITKNT